MRVVAWIVPLLLLGLSGCVNIPPDNKTTVVQPSTPAVVAPAAPAVVAPAPGTTVITRP